ncbi:MAG: aldo/keto reductase, partial [Prevotella sp.]|nr:aldo/keto reductase [Prevotella sp.]
TLERILSERPSIEVVQLQFNYLDYEDKNIQSRLCYEVCVKYGKPVIVMEPVRGGSLVNLPEAGLQEIQKLGEYSPAGYAIRYAASFDNIFMVLSGMSSIEQMNDYVARIKRMLELLPLPGFIGSDEIPQDYTHLIVNPGFEDGLNGWINEPAFTECKPTNWATMLDGKFMTGKYYVNLFSAPDTGQAGTLCQTINNLPAGNYYVEAAVFSNRNGLKFFVNSVEVAIPIGPEKPPYGSLYGAYVTLAEGEPLVFGVRTNEAVEFWGGVDNFKLTRYVKDPAGISQIQVEHKPTAIHSLSGVSSVSLRNGLNIVRYSNGTVKKIIKK